MQIVIEISEEEKSRIDSGNDTFIETYKVLKNAYRDGKIIFEPHGRLIDENKMSYLMIEGDEDYDDGWNEAISHCFIPRRIPLIRIPQRPI